MNFFLNSYAVLCSVSNKKRAKYVCFVEKQQLVRTLKKRKQRLVLESVGNKLPNVKKEVDNLATRILDSK